jgi:hypothetical protein
MNLQRFLLGSPLHIWLAAASTTHLFVMLMFAADAAGSNGVATQLFVALAMSLRSVGGLILVSHEKCRLHQIARAYLHVNESVSGRISASLSGVSRIVDLLHHRTCVRKSTHDYIDKHFQYELGHPPPSRYTTSEAFRSQLLKLLTMPLNDINDLAPGEDEADRKCIVIVVVLRSFVVSMSMSLSLCHGGSRVGSGSVVTGCESPNLGREHRGPRKQWRGMPQASS